MKHFNRVLIIGHRGMLASALQRALRKRGVDFTGVDRDSFDVTDPTQVDQIFRSQHPTLVFNCAAFTNVDGCESDEAAARKLNGDAVGFLAEAAKKTGARLVHYSTDFVFDGEKKTPYSESDRPNPLSSYGKTKLLGEENLRQINPPGYLLLRTAWLYGTPGKCFPRTMVELARKGIDPLKVVADQQGSPTLTDDLAEATLDLVDRDASGLFHATNSGQTNWCDFTRAIFHRWQLPNHVEPLTSAQWQQIKPTAAHRPASSVLDLRKIQDALGRPMRGWTEALSDYHAQTEQSGF